MLLFLDVTPVAQYVESKVLRILADINLLRECIDVANGEQADRLVHVGQCLILNYLLK